jgi:hypothetical protein
MVMSILTWLIRVCALIALVLGIVFWSGNALFLIPVHIALGIILTLSLILAGILVRIARGGSWGLMIGAFLLSIVVVLFGLRQSSLLTGELHWIIRVIHLLLGISMVLYVGVLARHYKHVQKESFA